MDLPRNPAREVARQLAAGVPLRLIKVAQQRADAIGDSVQLDRPVPLATELEQELADAAMYLVFWSAELDHERDGTDKDLHLSVVQAHLDRIQGHVAQAAELLYKLMPEEDDRGTQPK